MQPDIAAEMERIIDDYVEFPAFNSLLKSFIAIKAAERSQWAEITQLAHCMFHGSSPHINRLAALTEIIVLALDIVDDMQDQDNAGILWMKTPQGYTLNAVIALLMAAVGEAARLEVANRQGAVPIVLEISRILGKALDGQYKDLAQAVVTEADYMQLIQEKSGSLVRLACYMGYSSTTISTADMETMNELACCIGAIAQIDNDIKDVLRFDLKNDLLHKKKTLPILFLLAEPDADFPYIQQYYANELAEDQFLLKKKECIQYILDSGCIEYSRVIQQLWRNMAEPLFAQIDAALPWKLKFGEAVFLIEREQLQET